MDSTRLDALIKKLANEGEKSSTPISISFKDESTHLSEKRKNAWAGILSSAASAEGSEERVILPILEAFNDYPELRRYLKTHLEDEARHQNYLKRYMKESFNFEKKSKTITDVVVYDGVFGLVQKISHQRPLPIIIAILFYENFAEEFYSKLAKQAHDDGLQNLKSLFEHIEKDELRHRAGIKAVLNLWSALGRKVDTIDLILTKLLLEVTRLDVNTASWAVYNKKLKINLTELGIDCEKMYLLSKEYADRAYNELKSLRYA